MSAERPDKKRVIELSREYGDDSSKSRQQRQSGIYGTIYNCERSADRMASNCLVNRDRHGREETEYSLRGQSMPPQQVILHQQFGAKIGRSRRVIESHYEKLAVVLLRETELTNPPRGWKSDASVAQGGEGTHDAFRNDRGKRRPMRGLNGAAKYDTCQPRKRENDPKIVRR